MKIVLSHYSKGLVLQKAIFYVMASGGLYSLIYITNTELVQDPNNKKCAL